MDYRRAMDNLRKRGFTVSYFETGAAAAEYVAGQNTGKTIGIGGSKTIEALGLYEMLSRNNTVYWHCKQQPVDEARQKAANTEVYLSSANAIAETGEIVNIDGTGNRVAAMTYGHRFWQGSISWHRI